MSYLNSFPKHLRRWLLATGTAMALLLAFWVVVSAQSTPLSSYGYLDFSYQGWSGAGSPTGEKLESKLWWNDGFWWGALYNSSAGALHIYRLNWGTQTWEDTGVAIDDRDNTKTDTLWDATTSKLYIASHVAVDSDGEESSNPANWARLYRYTYSTALQTYTLDANFPAVINRDVSETLALAKGSPNRLWITYISRGITSSDYRVFVNSSGNDGVSWGNAFVPTLSPAITATHVARGDIVGIVTVGNKVGIMWNNSIEKALAHSTLNFAIHDANSTGGDWATQTITVPHGADDHVSIRSLQTTGNGQVFAAIKTDVPISGTITTTLPLIGLVARDLTDPGGEFVFREYSRNTDKDTRPVLVIDEGNVASTSDDKVFIFVTGKESGSKICYKSLAITFPLGNMGTFPVSDCGTSFIEDATYESINNATTTKQNVNKTTGLVILASDDVAPVASPLSRVYVHNTMGNPPPVMTARGPLPGATGILLSAVVTATFSKDINPATLTGSTFTIKNANGAVAGSLGYQAGSRTASFTPNSTLAANTVYTVELTNGIQDTTGQGLNEGIDLGPVIEQWSFTTAAPSVAFTTAGYNANEIDGTALITVALDALSAQPVTVTYTTGDGTAQAGLDYVATSGALRFNPGETRKTFLVPIIDDADTDGTELVNLTLSNPVSATLGLVPTATLTIIDDDSTTVQFAAASFSVNENGSQALIDVTLSRAAVFSITIDYTTSDGTATAVSDYSAATGTLTFAPGELSKAFAVLISDDSVFEHTETVNLTLRNANPFSATTSAPGNSAILTVVDDDLPPVVTFNSAAYTTNEGAGAATITAVLGTASSLPVTVTYSTSNGTAIAVADYTATTAAVIFAPGETSKTFTVAITNDNLDEADEVINLALSAPGNATLGTPSVATLTVVDDDLTPTVQFAQANFSAGEADGTIAVTVTLSAPSGKLVTVDYASSDGSAREGEDYASVNGTLTFAPGETRQSIEITLLNDTIAEASETVLLALSKPTGATSGGQASSTLTIVDNDVAVYMLYLPLVDR